MSDNMMEEFILSFLRRANNREEEDDRPGPSSSRRNHFLERELFFGMTREPRNRLREFRDQDRHHRMRGPRDVYRNRYMDDTSPEKFYEVSNMTPKFRLRDGVEYINILSLFERNAAVMRTRGITIILRGPTGCGQSNLASLIVQKEKSVGNTKGVIKISSRESYRDYRERYMMERYREKLFNTYIEAVREKKYNFFVVELDSPSMYDIKKFYEAAHNFAKSSQHVFLVELSQPIELVKQYAKGKKSDEEIEKEFEEMKVAPPQNIMLLDAEPIYKSDRVLDKMNSIIDRHISRNDYSINAHRYYEIRPDWAFTSLASLTLPDPESGSKIRESLTDPVFVDLIKSTFLHLKIDHRSYESLDKPNEEFRKLLKKSNAFTPTFCTDYGHKTRNPSLYEHAKKFQPTKIFDYKHSTTENLLMRHSIAVIDKNILKNIKEGLVNDEEPSKIECDSEAEHMNHEG